MKFEIILSFFIKISIGAKSFDIVDPSRPSSGTRLSPIEKV